VSTLSDIVTQIFTRMKEKPKPAPAPKESGTPMLDAIKSQMGESEPPPRKPKPNDGKDLPLPKFSHPLPFESERSVRHCTSGFYIGGDFYRDIKKDLLCEKIRCFPDPELKELRKYWCYRDKYGRHIFHRNARVPCFDEFDRAKDWRFWEWFYFVEDAFTEDIESLKTRSLACFFGDRSKNDWYWFVYENISIPESSPIKGQKGPYTHPSLQPMSYAPELPDQIIEVHGYNSYP
jgi:hypothetical protein